MIIPLVVSTRKKKTDYLEAVANIDFIKSY